MEAVGQRMNADRDLDKHARDDRRTLGEVTRSMQVVSCVFARLAFDCLYTYQE